MKHLKRFESTSNEVNLEEYKNYGTLTFKDLFGEIETEEGSHYNKFSITNKGVYIYGYGKKEAESNFMSDLVTLYKERSYDNYTIYAVYGKKSTADKYGYEFGYLLTKGGNPYLFSGIPGDNYGATVFKGIFKVSGHDGSYLFDIDNPLDMQADLK